MSAVESLRYRGIDQHGVARTGASIARTPIQMVSTYYAAGWRSLTVMRQGEEVGAIRPDLDTGRRTWWAEQ